MPRGLAKLSAQAVKNSKKRGRHSDGGGLYLNVSRLDTRSWVFIWVAKGKKREMGLGAYPAVSLTDARDMAAAYRREVALGRDPIKLRDKASEPTFGGCVDEFLTSMETSWKNPKHRAQWRSTLETYCAAFWSTPVSSVGNEEVLAALQPIWTTIPETASRLRGRIERVLDLARAKGWRVNANPAQWRGHLKLLLPPPKKLIRGHHAAMPYADVPAFCQKLPSVEGLAARGLELLILTASRTGEILGARRTEFDRDKALWSIPAERMKAGKEHRVPLTDRAVDIVDELEAAAGKSEWLFPGDKKGRPLSNMAMAMVMRRLEVGHYTVHGFRSAFRDWAGDETNHSREIIEVALAHLVGSKTEVAYWRSDMLAKRRALMVDWENYLLGRIRKNVIPLPRREPNRGGTKK